MTQDATDVRRLCDFKRQMIKFHGRQLTKDLKKTLNYKPLEAGKESAGNIIKLYFYVLILASETGHCQLRLAIAWDSELGILIMLKSTTDS